MDFIIPDILKENKITFVIAVVFSVISISIKLVKSIFDFLEDYILKRHLKRISELSQHCNEKDIIHKYFKRLRETEMFYLTSGIKTSPKRSEMLMNIYISGYLSIQQLKDYEPYILPSKEKIAEIKVGLIRGIYMIYSFFANLFFFIVGIAMGLPFFFYKSNWAMIAGMIIMLTYSFIAALLGKEFRIYLGLRAFKKKLKTNKPA